MNVAVEISTVSFLHKVVEAEVDMVANQRIPVRTTTIMLRVVPGTNGETFRQVTCFGCQFLGHYRNQCPHAIRTGVTVINVGHVFTQGPLFHVPKSWVLLDTCSTCDVSNNRDLVINIQKCSPTDSLTASTNGGEQK